MDGEQSEVQPIDIQPKTTVHARKIHEQDPAFLGHLQSDRLHNEVEAAQMSVGEDILADVNVYRENARSERAVGRLDGANGFLLESEQTLNTARQELRTVYYGTKEQRPSREMRKYIEKTLFTILKDLKGDVREVKDIFNKDKVSNAVLEIAFARYDEEYRAKQEALRHNGEIYKAKFKERIEKLYAGGEIDINLPLIEKRLERVQFHMQDPLGFSNLYPQVGSSDNLFELVGISAAVDEGDMETNVFHELLHQVAGRTIVQFTKESMEDGERVKGSEEELDNLFQSDTGVVVPRAGLRFTAYADMSKTRRAAEGATEGSHRNERFSWLDEAVTEDLTHKLLPNLGEAAKGQAYVAERQLFDVLTQVSRVEKKAFYDAYFENDREAGMEDSTLPARRSLFQAINQNLGHGTLREIDQMIIEDPQTGIARAIRRLQEINQQRQLELARSDNKDLLAA